jgi:hypothetical protein
MDVTFDDGRNYGEGKGWFAIFFALFIIFAVMLFAVINTKQSANQGADAEWMRQCMNDAGPDARFIAKVNKDMFYRFCETYKRTIIVQSLTKEGAGQYTEDSIREMTYLRRIHEALYWAKDMGYQIIGWLP